MCSDKTIKSFYNILFNKSDNFQEKQVFTVKFLLLPQGWLNA